MMERPKAACAALAALAQRRAALAATALGLIAACAFPPLHLWPLGLAALAGFVWLIHKTLLFCHCSCQHIRIVFF